jgi:hypothetical protein
MVIQRRARGKLVAVPNPCKFYLSTTAWRVTSEEIEDVARLPGVVLVAVEEIVVARIGGENAQARIRRTASATRTTWSSVSATPLGR